MAEYSSMTAAGVGALGLNRIKCAADRSSFYISIDVLSVHARIGTVSYPDQDATFMSKQKEN
jgi:hypothetical protein